VNPGRDNTARARLAAVERRRTIAAVVAIVALAVVTVAVFAKDNPFASHREVKAVFSSAVALRDGADVRVAGINVGTVTSVESYRGSKALVTMELDDSAPGLYRDARFSIEPRLVLEGNFYVKVEPGSPGAPRLGESATVPVAQTAAPVQIDQALGVFTAPVRERLATIFSEFAAGFGKDPAGGRSGAESLRVSVTRLDAALGAVRNVARSARGRRAGDLREAIGETGDVAEQLVADPRRLADFMTDYAHVSATLAARDVELGRSIEAFDRTFATAPRVLPRVDNALDELTGFAPELKRALRNAPPALRATSGLLDQIDAAVRAPELPALLTRLRPATRVLPEFLRRLEGLAPPAAEVGRCLSKTVLPTLDRVVPDGKLTTGDPAWLELMHLGGSAGGSSAGFDGNGSALRLGITEGEQTLTGNLPNLGPLETLIPANSSMNPEWLGFGHFPQMRPSKRCADQQLPNLAARAGKRPFDWLTPAPAAPAAVDGGPKLADRLARAVKRIEQTASRARRRR
jgi:virulence factor Mce-like protein